MNIVVAMKQIPDLQQIRIRNRQPVLDGVPMGFGNIDKNALEAGVILKEQLGEGKVVVVSVGSPEVEETIKEALAAGADEGFLVIDEEQATMESSRAALILAESIRKIEDAGIILFGEGSGDNYSGQVGSRVAEILNLPQVSYVSSIEVEGNTARVSRSLEEGEEKLQVELPAVFSVLADINEPRIPSVTQILKAGKKPKEVLELDDFDVDLDIGARVVTVSNLAPESSRKQIKINSADELIHSLKTEGVI